MDGPPSLAPGLAVTPNVRLRSPLGSGGMGAVWLADHEGLRTQVVVKFLLGGGAGDAPQRARFAREAAAAAQVKSPHVVQMLDHGVTEQGLPFIVMEHLEGKDLGRVLAEKGALDPVDALAVVTQVAKALGKVHAAGLLHRDIKPDNIFLCDSDEEVFVKLLDFGIAKRDVSTAGDDGSLDGSTNTGQVVGTPFYMSPEQVTAQKGIDARSDLWSLGVVAFQLLTGARPFDGPSFGALAVRIATGAPPRLTDEDETLPKELDAWFARACAREPADRFGSARELADGLRVALGGLVPPMSDSGQRSLSASRPSGRGRAISGDGLASEASGTPSFENAATLKSDAPAAAAGGAQLGATGSAVALGRASRAEDASGARRRKHVALGTAFALGSAALVVLLSRMGATPRSEGSVPSPEARTSAPKAVALTEAPRAAPSALGTTSAEPAGLPTASPDASAAVVRPAPDAGRETSVAGPFRARGDAGAVASATARVAGAPSASASSSGARPGLRPPGSHDDPLY